MPEKPNIKKAAWGSVGPSKMVTLRMPIELIEKLDAASARLGISKTAIICRACLESLDGGSK